MESGVLGPPGALVLAPVVVGIKTEHANVTALHLRMVEQLALVLHQKNKAVQPNSAQSVSKTIGRYKN